MFKRILEIIIKSKQAKANEYIEQYMIAHPELGNRSNSEEKKQLTEDVKLVKHVTKKKDIFWFWTNPENKVISPLHKTEDNAKLWFNQNFA